MKTKSLAIFFHVEKCGGTSLIAASRMRNQLKHCDLVVSKSNRNCAAERDFRNALKAYPQLDFIAGHSLNPSNFETYKSIALERGYRDVYSVTLIRDPLKRLLSDYVHDVSRRGSDISLSEYLEITWKQNYITRFFGVIGERSAHETLSKLDVVDTTGGNQVRLFLGEKGFKFAMESSFQSNVFEGKPPKCLAVENGVEIGKYKISTEDKARFEQLNLDDIALFAELRSNMTAFTQPTKKQEAKVSEKTSRSTYQRLYRNFVYKPVFNFRVGMTALPRNNQPAQLIKFQTNSIWSNVLD